MGKSSKKQTVGYKYRLGMHLVACQRGIGAHLLNIKVSDKMVYEGPGISDTTRILINKPELFGGDEKEGGIDGYVDVLMGKPDQPQNDYLRRVLGGWITPQLSSGFKGLIDAVKAGNLQATYPPATDYPRIPAFRGVVSLALNHMLLATNSAYLKPWAVRISSVGPTGGDMNPVDIVKHCITSRSFGLGFPEEDVDLPSFAAAKATVAAEGLLTSFVWNDQEPVEEFVKTVLTHIDGFVYLSPSTGKFTLVLARDDYDVDELPVFDTSNVVSIESFKRKTPGELYNQITVTYVEGESHKTHSVTRQDPASISIQGNVNAMTTHYSGVTNGEMAAKLASRDLKQSSQPLASLTLITNRSGLKLLPGSVFKLRWKRLGLESGAIFRVMQMNPGTMENGQVRVMAVEDAFGFNSSVYAPPAPSQWEPVVNVPAAPVLRKLIEAPYALVEARIAQGSSSTLATIDAGAAFLSMYAVAPPGGIDYEIHESADNVNYTKQDTGLFTPNCVTAVAIGRFETIIQVASVDRIESASIPGLAMLGDEIVNVVDTQAGGKLVVERGCLDTPPLPHAAGTRVLFTQGTDWTQTTEYGIGETRYVKQLTRTNSGKLALADAPADSVTFYGRFIKPLPPGNLRVNAMLEPTTVDGTAALTWNHRDRKNTAAAQPHAAAADYGPEANTTYTVNLYNAKVGGTLIQTVTGLTGKTYSYSRALAKSNNGGVAPSALRVEVLTQRDGHSAAQVVAQAFDWTGAAANISARYWRVLFTSTMNMTLSSGVAPTLYELYLIGVGNVDLVRTGKTYSASSAANPAANAFDGNTGTIWSPTDLLIKTTPQWVAIDMAAAVDVIGIGMRVYANSSTSNAARIPRDFVVQCSDDGTNWTSVRSITKTDWSTSAVARYDFTI